MIYLADMKDFNEDFFQEIITSLPLTVRQHINKNLSQNAKKQSILAWFLLQQCLIKEFNICEFEIFKGLNSKPYLKDSNLFFNLSHSKNMAVCVVSENEIGVDIQSKISYNEKVVQKFFSKGEIEILKKSENQDDLFTKIWSLKESFLKMSGQGVSVKAKDLDFSKNLNQSSFNFIDYQFNVIKYENFYLSICSNQDNMEIKVLTALDFQ